MLMLVATTVTIHWWLLPVILTVIMLGMMFRPMKGDDLWGLQIMARGFWSVPIMFVWIVYLLVSLAVAGRCL